jgi:hypothetical protein
MSALSDSAFKRHDQVVVIKSCIDHGLHGRVVREMRNADEYLIEFPDGEQRIYEERDLTLDPKRAVRIPMV